MSSKHVGQACVRRYPGDGEGVLAVVGSPAVTSTRTAARRPSSNGNRVMNVRQALIIYRKVGPKLFASWAMERPGRALSRWHLSKLAHYSESLMRRVLGDPVAVDVEDLRLQGPFESRWMLARLKAHCFEPFEMQLVKDAIRPGMTVLDIGANIGLYSLIASRRVGDEGVVYAFEPDPRNQAQLQVNVAVNKCRNIRIFDSAVGESAGSGIFQLAQAPTHSSFFRSMGDMPLAGTIEADVVAIDDVVGDHETIDVIKMDIEGGEAAALRGMRSTLRRNPNLRMFIEFEPSALRSAGWSPEDVLSSLQALFEKIYVIDEATEKLIPITDATLGRTQSLYCLEVRSP